MKVLVSIADVVIGKKMLPSIHESLQERGTIQTIALDRNTALEVQVRNSKFLKFKCYCFTKSLSLLFILHLSRITINHELFELILNIIEQSGSK